MYKIHNATVYKSEKFPEIYIPAAEWKRFKDKEGSPIEVKITKEKSKTFLTRLHQSFYIRKNVNQKLQFEEDDSIDVTFRFVKSLERPGEMIKGDKFDVLAIIPEQTSKGYDMVVSKFQKGGEEWLRVWYSHPKGSSSQLEIRRFINPRKFGRLLGQYQAEGTKGGRKYSRLEFGNSLIKEHEDFLKYLKHVGVDHSFYAAHCTYNNSKISKKELSRYCAKYEKVSGVKIECKSSLESRGPGGIKTLVRNGVLTEVILFALRKVRKKLTEGDHSEYIEKLREGFLAKLLSGDGTLDTTISPAREYNNPSINIKIVDQDIEALYDYKSIMENLGFHPHVNEKHIWTKSSCSLENLLHLYEIKAFDTTTNWKKLILTIAILLKGRRYKTYKRFLDLVELEKFSSKMIKEKYQVGQRAANKWIHNKVEEELVEKVRDKPFPKLYKVTKKGERLANLLENALRKSSAIQDEEGSSSSEGALESIKTKFQSN